MALSTDKERQLEVDYFDSEKISQTIDSLINICYGKAEHVQINYADETLSRAWDRLARAFESALAEALKID